jgi:hypothetical protein
VWAISTVGLHIELQRHTPVGSTIGPAIFEAYALGSLSRDQLELPVGTSSS